MVAKIVTPALAATRQPGRKIKASAPKSTRLAVSCKCPLCGGPVSGEALFIDEWLPEFEMLSARFADTGITSDLAALCLCECFGLFLWLSRRSES